MSVMSPFALLPRTMLLAARWGSTSAGTLMLLVVLLVRPIAAQPILDFALGLGGSGDDRPSRIAIDTFGNVFVTGSFEGTADFDPGLGVTNLTSVGGADGFVAKYDAAGILAYAFGLGGPDQDRGLGLAIDPSGNIHVAGFFLGTVDFNPGPGVTNLTSVGGADGFVAKYDAAGNLVFALGLGGPGFRLESFGTVTVDASGNVYLTGAFEGPVDFDPGPGVTNLTSVGDVDVFVAKYDAVGALDFAFRLGGTGTDVDRGLALDSFGNMYVTGVFEGTVDFDPGPGVTNLTSDGSLSGLDSFVAKYDSAGNLDFAFALVAPGEDRTRAMVDVDASGNVYVTGAFEGTVDFDPGPGVTNLTSAGGFDVFVAKYDGMGALASAFQLGGTGLDAPGEAALDSLGNVYVTGVFEDTVDFDPGPGVTNLTSAGALDGFVAKYGAIGNLVSVGGLHSTAPFSTEGAAIAVNTLGDIHVAGYFEGTADFDPGPGVTNLTSAGAFDIFVARYIAPVRNATQGTVHVTIAEAFLAAVGDDELIVPDTKFHEPPGIVDFARKSIKLRSTGVIDQLPDGSIVLADRSVLAAGTGYGISLAGSLRVEVGDRTDIDCSAFLVTPTGSLRAKVASIVDVSTATADLGGEVVVDPEAVLAFNSSVQITGELTIDGGTLVGSAVQNSHQLNLFGGNVKANSLNNAGGGFVLGWGSLFADVTNDGTATFVLDTQVAGDYTNNGNTVIQSGKLTIVGSLTDNGTIVGNLNVALGAGGGLPPAPEEEEPESGLTIIGDYNAAPDASLVMPSEDLTVRIGGNFNVAIDSSTRYDMVQATLELVGIGTTPQTLEVMSTDDGPVPEGLDVSLAGHYPLGVLHLGPTATTVDLVDTHDNDGLGQNLREALYVSELVVDSRVTLNTNGFKIYYETLILEGNVEEPMDLVPIESFGRFRRGDCNDDDTVDISDPIFVLNYLFTGGPSPSCIQTADVNDDNAADVSDPVYQLNHLFGGGPPLAAPAGECGTDPTPAANAEDDLSCEAYPPCE